MSTDDQTPGEVDTLDPKHLHSSPVDENVSADSVETGSDDKNTQTYVEDQDEAEAERVFQEIKHNPLYVDKFEKFFDSDDDDYAEPKPDDGYYKEEEEFTLRHPPNFDTNVDYESEHDDTIDTMEVEEAQKVRDPNYIKTIDLDDPNQDFDLDRVDFSKSEAFKKNAPKGFTIQSAHGNLVEDTRAIPIDIITREQWGALPRPEGEEPLEIPVLYVHMEYFTPVDACFNKEDCMKAAREIQRLHIEGRGLPDIAHNFLIGGDGNVYEGRGWTVKAEKTTELPKYSGKYVEFAYIGDYRVVMQTDLIMKTQFSLIKQGLDLNYIDGYFTLILKQLNLTRDWIGK